MGEERRGKGGGKIKSEENEPSVCMRERVTVVPFSVCLSVCPSETDFEDGFVLSLQTDIKAWQATV